MPPVNTLAAQLWKRVRQGVAGTRRKEEEVENHDYQPDRHTDAFDNRWLGKYFHVALKTRR